jgi:hypothetical protein
MDLMFVCCLEDVRDFFRCFGRKTEGRERQEERIRLFFVTSCADPSSQYVATTARDLHCIVVRYMERSYQEEARGVEIIKRS